MVTPCPLCHLSLDAWQAKASKEADMRIDMPILHLAQLVGAAAGLSYDELLFKRHVVKTAPVHRQGLRASLGLRAGAEPMTQATRRSSAPATGRSWWRRWAPPSSARWTR